MSIVKDEFTNIIGLESLSATSGMMVEPSDGGLAGNLGLSDVFSAAGATECVVCQATYCSEDFKSKHSFLA